MFILVLIQESLVLGSDIIFFFVTFFFFIEVYNILRLFLE